LWDVTDPRVETPENLVRGSDGVDPDSTGTGQALVDDVELGPVDAVVIERLVDRD
jgi:hypothetical protein